MHLKKISLAVAIGATLAAPAAMAQSSVQLYGKLYPFLLDERGSGATQKGTAVSTLAQTPTGVNAVSTFGMAAGNSAIGFRGVEDLGGGFHANFQLEGQASVDDGSGSGTGGGFQFNRNTYVGLSGPLGTLKLGNVDTIFKTYGDTIGFLGVSSGTFMSSSGVLRKSGFGTSSASSFHLRRANSVVYETPKLAGFTAGLQYSTDEAKTDTRNPRVYSMGVKWNNGPFYVALAHEIHYDLYGGSNNAPTSMRNNATVVDPTRSKDTATEFTVEYHLNKVHRFEFDAIRKEYNENATVAGRFSSYKNMAYLLAMENRWSAQWRTVVQYVVSRAGDCSRVAAVCTTDGLEGNKFTVGGAYYLSKRTYLFAAASRLTNGTSARYSNTDFGAKPNAGEDIRHFAVGVTHRF